MATSLEGRSAEPGFMASVYSSFDVHPLLDNLSRGTLFFNILGKILLNHYESVSLLQCSFKSLIYLNLVYSFFKYMQSYLFVNLFINFF
jgi:hypothetical protein